VAPSPSLLALPATVFLFISPCAAAILFVAKEDSAN